MSESMTPITRPFMSKKDFAYRTLRGWIREGTLPPGSRLVIDDLARKLAISPIPVREALQQLQADSYVIIEPYVGARVTDLEADSIHELFEVIEALEVISSRAACIHMSEQDLDEMELLLRKMDSLIDDPEAWSQANMQLHELICEKARTHLIGGLLKRTLDHWDRLSRFYFEPVFVRRLERAHRDHWRILEALRSRDPEKVEKLVREHNREAVASYLDHLHDKNPVAPELVVEKDSGGCR